MNSLEEIFNQTIKSGGRIDEFVESDFGVFVVTGLQQSPNTIESRIGKVVQVRQEYGEWGSDMVFIRHINNKITTHENQCFYRVSKENTLILKSLFKDTFDDKPNETYSIKGEDEETGFIIKSKIKEGETTPMRQVKNALYNKIGEILTKNDKTK